MTASRRRKAPSIFPAEMAADQMITAILDGLDHFVGEYERKWGYGRLRLLVSDDLRARFDRQRQMLDAALQSGLVEHVQIYADGMRRAWQALDRAATEAGHPLLSPAVWECKLPTSGEIIAIVRTEAEARHVAGETRAFTLAEVAVAIEALGPTVLAAKQAFPGATVNAVHTTKPPT